MQSWAVSLALWMKWSVLPYICEAIWSFLPSRDLPVAVCPPLSYPSQPLWPQSQQSPLVSATEFLHATALQGCFFCCSGLSTFSAMWDTWDLDIQHPLSYFSSSSPLIVILEITFASPEKEEKCTYPKYSYYGGMQLEFKCCGVLAKDLQLLQIPKAAKLW